MRLVSPGQQGEPVRARVPRRQVVTAPDQDQLVDQLVKTRLVTSDDGVLQLAHEALARAWPRLRGWLEDDIEGQRILHHLSATADIWDALGRPDSELYRGVRLAQALEWRERPHADLTDVEAAFLDVSAALAEAEERAAADQLRQKTRLIRRLRIVLAGGCVLLLVALAAGGYAAYQQNQAEDNAETARQAAVSSDARRVGARSQLTEDISLSLLLAAAGARLDESPETRVNLSTALAKWPTLVRSAPPGGGYLEGLDVSRDGRWIAASDDQNRMHLYDAATNRLLRSYDAGRPAEDGQAFIDRGVQPRQHAARRHPGRRSSTEPVRLLDPDTMEPTATKLAFPGGEPVVGADVEFSADGRYLAASVQTVRWCRGIPRRPRPTRWSGTCAPRAHHPCGCHRPVLPGAGAQPGRPDPVHQWAADGVRRGDGKQIWRREELTSYTVLDVNVKGPLLALRDEEALKDVVLVEAATGRTVAGCTGTGTRSATSQFSPDGTLRGGGRRR